MLKSKFVRVSAWVFVVLNVAIAIYTLGNGLLMLLFRGPFVPQLYLGGLLTVIVLTGWIGFLGRCVWARYLLLAALVGSLIFPTAMALTGTNGGEWAARIILILVQIAVLLAAMLSGIRGRLFSGTGRRESSQLRGRTRVVAWIYMVISLYIFGMFAMFSMSLRGPRHMYISVTAQILVYATQWVFWLLLLKRRAWAWWVLVVEYASFVICSLWSMGRWSVARHHAYHAPRHHAMSLTYAVLWYGVYLVAYMLPLWALFTDRPIGRGKPVEDLNAADRLSL
jgi:hypothetical protein